jgi:hypothetical protein
MPTNPRATIQAEIIRAAIQAPDLRVEEEEAVLFQAACPGGCGKPSHFTNNYFI